MAESPTITLTIALPPDTVAEVNGLIADLRTVAQKYATMADKCDAALDAIKAAADAGTQAVTAIQGDVKQAADAVTAFHIQGKGPFGSEISGGSN